MCYIFSRGNQRKGEKKMQADYHIHTEFSDDSKEPMEAQIERAIALGLDEICFTDHVDYGVKRDWDDPRGVLYRADDSANPSAGGRQPLANVDYPKYFAKIHAMREKYAGKIRIKAGLEFGIQTITLPAFERLFARYQDELDFTLLSMHQVGNQEFWTGDYTRGRTQADYNDAYYEEIYAVQQRFKHYSVLAHLDLLARYDPAGPYPFAKEKDKIAEILKLAIKDGKGIEINTSSWHYGLSDTQPSRDILRLYKDLGGRVFTFGSDAHRTSYLADHFADARRIVRDEIGLTEFCTFDHGQPAFHPIED